MRFCVGIEGSVGLGASETEASRSMQMQMQMYVNFFDRFQRAQVGS
jgi:hypothetical protein